MSFLGPARFRYQRHLGLGLGLILENELELAFLTGRHEVEHELGLLRGKAGDEARGGIEPIGGVLALLLPGIERVARILRQDAVAGAAENGSVKPFAVLVASDFCSPLAEMSVAVTFANLSSNPGETSRRFSPYSPKRTTAFCPSDCSIQIWCACTGVATPSRAIMARKSFVIANTCTGVRGSRTSKFLIFPHDRCIRQNANAADTM